MLASSQNPDRVSNILRSSVVTMRPSGIPVAWSPWSCVRHGADAWSEGGHATLLLVAGLSLVVSRWVSAVSWRNISSRRAPSAGRSSITGTPAAKAIAPTCAVSAWASSPSVPDEVRS